ncbi:hypothetical protein EI77_03709 [Prosthecobacter fusiformis]|uniref:SGNH/GDSL hydrolase family protein n=1 Tax=Prosthecobacter fusiformis TaxID=48464 RepID=A0A4R7RMJ3_9BACT|nr:hypothetical protein [Prosthecobacter fusiformis]TDU66614.1 hypothetical protein EI77_03709 [Prosthecobacter fusiformis]
MNAVPSSHWSRRKIIQAGLASLICPFSSRAQSTAPSVRILFLGNSYTYGNELPEVVAALLRSSQVLEPQIGSYTQGGYKLAEHASDAQAMALLKQGAPDGRPWDVLVVQEQSIVSAISAVNEEARRMMRSGLNRLVVAAREANPRMLVVDFQVWARHERLWEQQKSDAFLTGGSSSDAHSRIRQQNAEAVNEVLQQIPEANLLISPVGDFWKLVRETYPDLVLHSEDGTHPSILGTHLTGLVIAGTIGGRKVIEQATWIGSSRESEVKLLKAVLLDHPEVFRMAGK